MQEIVRTETAPRSAFARRYGKTAVVTGASDGIGRAFAEELAALGLDLVLVARRRPLLDDLAQDLSSRYRVAASVVDADLADPAGVARVIAAAETLEVGLLVAAAGYGTSGPFIDAPLRDELDMLTVNCSAVLVMSHAFGRRFAAQRRGGLILLGSLVGFQGTPGAANYAATKAYVQTLAEGLRAELAASAVDVLSVAPGPVASGFAERAGMRMGSTVSPRTVARGAIAALGRRTTVRPGFLSKALEAALAPLPRTLRVRIMGGVMAGMTKHRNEAGTNQAVKPA